MIIADKGARVGNVIIDAALCLILVIIAGMVVAMFVAADGFIWTVCIGLSYVGYYFLFEFFLGKTPGKYLTRTRVVTHKGGKPGIRKILIRSVARLVPYDYFSFIFGQGLHDSISGTVVISAK